MANSTKIFMSNVSTSLSADEINTCDDLRQKLGQSRSAFIRIATLKHIKDIKTETKFNR